MIERYDFVEVRWGVWYADALFDKEGVMVSATFPRVTATEGKATGKVWWTVESALGVKIALDDEQDAFDRAQILATPQAVLDRFDSTAHVATVWHSTQGSEAWPPGRHLTAALLHRLKKDGCTGMTLTPVNGPENRLADFLMNELETS